MQVNTGMGIDNMVARMGLNRNASMKFLPLIVLVLIWLWIVLILTVLGLNTTTFHSLFGWTAMIPHI